MLCLLGIFGYNRADYGADNKACNGVAVVILVLVMVRFGGRAMLPGRIGTAFVVRFGRRLGLLLRTVCLRPVVFGCRRFFAIRFLGAGLLVMALFLPRRLTGALLGPDNVSQRHS